MEHSFNDLKPFVEMVVNNCRSKGLIGPEIKIDLDPVAFALQKVLDSQAKDYSDS